MYPDQQQRLVAQPLGHQGPYIKQYVRSQHHSALPSLDTSLVKAKSHHFHPYHSGFYGHCHQTPPTPLSPSTLSAHSEASYADTFQDKSPSLGYSTPESTSPAPLAALADAAVGEQEHLQARADASMLPQSTIPQPPAHKSDKTPTEQPAHEKAPRKRGSRGPRSALSPVEREMKRKIAHSKIEKHRRTRTNKVIDKMEKLIPASKKPARKLNKAEVLEASLSYMRELLGLPDEPLEGTGQENNIADDTKDPMGIDFLLS
ncbi:hypothetical protein GGI15_003016 [Coemansia interrupta]|uniref:BHLH domain-containing protein n=1 Tax=Coemansia interrupta TaxID=1126814 RepID=A0A9W8H9L6_9FUNG|nr:hypothetical protein GGI15_003016 [Coemansia interrupta]